MFQKIKNYFTGKTKGVNTTSGVWFDALGKSKEWNGSFLDAYAINLYVNAALRKRAAKFSEIQFKVKDSTGKEKENHDLINLLYNPNKYLTGKTFWKTYQIIKDAYGEVFIWLEPKNKVINSKNPNTIGGLHILEPNRVKIEWKEGEIVNYRYERKGDGLMIDYSPEQVLRDYYPSPKNPLESMSLLQAGYHTIDTDNQLSQYHSNILRNGGKVETVIKFKNEQISRQQIEESKDRYKKQYSEAKNSGTPLFLGGDADVMSLGLKPEELSFLESKKMSLNDICILTEVPKSLLGTMDDVKYSNAETSIRIFTQETIKPLMNDVVNLLNDRLFKDNEYLDFEDPSPEDKEEKRKDLETAHKVYALTVNEKREELGYEPVEGGDKVVMPDNLSGMNEEEPKKQIKTKNNDHPLRDYDMRRRYFEFKEKRLTDRESEMKKQVDNFFQNQKQRLTQYITGNDMRSVKKKDVLDQFWNEEREIKLAVETFTPLLREYLQESGQESVNFLDYEYDFKLDTDTESWLDQRANVLSKQINETTFKELKSQLQEGISAGETKEQLVNRVEATYGNISKNRARTIATTEVHGAMQKGTHDAYKQAGMRIKIWVAVLDSNTRDAHRSLDGEEVPLNGYFSNGLEHPGDPTGPPSEVVNCRCTI